MPFTLTSNSRSKSGFRRLLDRADVRDAGAVDEDVHGPRAENRRRSRAVDIGAIGHVARDGWPRAAPGHGFEIEHVHDRAVRGELLDDGEADAAGSAGDDGGLAGEAAAATVLMTSPPARIRRGYANSRSDSGFIVML